LSKLNAWTLLQVGDLLISALADGPANASAARSSAIDLALIGALLHRYQGTNVAAMHLISRRGMIPGREIPCIHDCPDAH